MIDRPSRERLALALRRFAIGRMTNDELQEQAPPDWRDRGAVAIAQIATCLYSDEKLYRLTGKHALARETRREIARWIVFLQSDQEYLWPEYSLSSGVRWPPWEKRSLRVGPLAEFSYSRRLAEFLEAGEAKAWPFIDGDHERDARATSRVFAGHAAIS